MAFLRKFLTGNNSATPSTTTPNRPDPNVIVTVIGAGSSINGVMTVQGGARVDGSFEGSLVVNGTLVIGPTARIICQEIRAQNALVYGTVKGNLTAERVEIKSTGKIFGNLLTDSLATEEGGYVRGEVTLSTPASIEENYELDAFINDVDENLADDDARQDATPA
jgi:cytoskeletal protein CcmA (bactofilin family)